MWYLCVCVSLTSKSNKLVNKVCLKLGYYKPIVYVLVIYFMM